MQVWITASGKIALMTSDNGVGRLQWSGLPGADFVDHRVGDGGDKVRRYLNAVQLAHMALDVPCAHATGVERDDLVVETGKRRRYLAISTGSKRP